MKGAVRIGSYKGIGIFIHWTFFLLLIWIGGDKMLENGKLSEVFAEIGFVLSVFMCVLLHEFGHALSAARYHIHTRDITLLPIGGVARLEKLPDLPRQELIVAMAGPFVNVLIILLLAVFIFFGKGFPIAVDFQDPSANSFVINLLMVNVSLVVFNLIPAFPMDGGRILRSLLAMKWSKQRATRIAVAVGQSIAVLFVIAGLFVNPFLILIGVFVFLGAQAELKMVLQQDALKGIRVKDVMISKYSALHDQDTLKQAAEALLAGDSTDFLVMDQAGQVSGVLTRDHLLKGFAEYPPGHPVADLILKNPLQFETEDDLDSSWEKMRATDFPLAPVYHQGLLTGVLSRENLTEFIALYLAGQQKKG
ncbi:MAG: site-2 protease family protein [Bacteroidia bacterium]|nr:site-2 protease family protein [Bacteroidia bacterium]